MRGDLEAGDTLPATRCPPLGAPCKYESSVNCTTKTDELQICLSKSVTNRFIINTLKTNVCYARRFNPLSQYINMLNYTVQMILTYKSVVRNNTLITKQQMLHCFGTRST